MSEKITMKVNILNELNQNDLFKLFKEYPNWFQLGGKVRSYFNDVRLTRNYPNDFELGKAISQFFSEKSK